MIKRETNGLIISSNFQYAAIRLPDQSSRLFAAILSNDKKHLVGVLKDLKKLYSAAVFESLLNDHNSFGATPLTCALKNGTKETALALLKHPKLDPNIPDSMGNTALLWAIENGDGEVTKALIKSKNFDLARQTPGKARKMALAKGDPQVLALFSGDPEPALRM